MTQTTYPLDIRLMNATAALAVLGVFLLVCAAAVSLLLRNPAFTLKNILIDGNPQYVNVASVRANVLPNLDGTLFTLDLKEAQDLFERIPWVRNAYLQRVFPATLRVHLIEHKPVAYWESEGDSEMLNSFGEVFAANRGEVEDQGLPNLAGPNNQSVEVLQMFNAVQQRFLKQPVSITALYLSAHGSWTVHLSNGAKLELGTGESQRIVLARLDSFLLSLPEAIAPFKRSIRALESADLRHKNGYAIRLKGVVTEGGKSETVQVKKP